MSGHASLLVWLATAVTLVRCRTVFPYLGSGNRFTVKTVIPMDFPTNVTFLRVRATSDTYVWPNESRVIEYAAVASTNRELPFKVTPDGGVQLSRQIKFKKKKKDRRKYKFNIVAGLATDLAKERAVLAVELIITRSSFSCDGLSLQERCWGPWTFLSGLQWFAAPSLEHVSARGDPLLLDLRSPVHTLCGAPTYSYHTETDPTKDTEQRLPEPVADGAAVSLPHLAASRSKQQFRLIVACDSPGAEKEDGSPEEKKTLGVEVLDRNNHGPELDDTCRVHNAYLCTKSILRKGDWVETLGHQKTQLPIRDRDRHDLSHYDVRVENDPKGLIDVEYGHFEVPYGKGEERSIESMLYAELKYKRDVRPYQELGAGQNYSVQVVFEDVYLHHFFGEKALRLTLNLLTSCPPSPSPPPTASTATVPPGTIYDVTLPRSAAKYARVFHPPAGLFGRRLRLTDRKQAAFGVTSRDAILYVARPGRLRALSGVVNLTLVSRGKDARADRDGDPMNITVRVNVTGDVDGCAPKNGGGMALCAAETSKDECTRRCGAGATGHCSWRPPLGNSSMTAEYGTCSPDLATCPDGTCDALERLSPSSCPQDCAGVYSDGVILKGGKSGRGIQRGRGVCFCLEADSCVCGDQSHAPLPSDNNLTEEERAVATSVTPRSELAATHEASPCGTACIIGVTLGVVLLLAMVFLACMIYATRCGRSSKMRKDPFGGEVISLSHITGDMDLGGRQQMALPAAAQCAISAQLLETVPVDGKWEFPRRRLILGDLLGEGEFGKVLKGKAMGISSDTGCSTVAVKMLKPSSTPSELQDLLSEYNLLKEVNHPNVIRLLGACTGPGGPVCIIMEFAELGCLRTYLYNSRKSTLASGNDDSACSITPKELISYAWQIARGMTYLGEMKLVHRDLAARNVLLADGKVCKISDFGLTRDVYEGSLYQKTSKGRVPVKWMAIESLEDHVYTSKSDVWSFGVLLWELITLGSNPYPGVTPERLCHLLKSGYRMDRPANCTQDMYSIMRQCWQEQPSSRPTFAELSQWFDRMLQSGSEYLDLSTPLVLNREYFDLLSDGDDLDSDRPIDYGNLHLLSSSYLPPRSQSSVDEPHSDQSTTRATSADQSSLSPQASDQSAPRPDRLVYSSLLLHDSETEDAADGAPRAGQLNYSSLLLQDSEPEDDRSGSPDSQARETCDEKCGLMQVSV